MGLSLIWCIQSWPRQEAVVPTSCLHHTEDHSTTEVWRKNTFFCMAAYFPRMWSVLWLCSQVDEKRLQWHRNDIYVNVNSDHDKTVVMEALIMGLLLSGLVWLKAKQKNRKVFFLTLSLNTYIIGVCSCFILTALSFQNMSLKVFCIHSFI